MGTRYTIDLDRRMVRSFGWGTLTARDFLDETSRKLADARFDSSFRSLCDLRQVTSVEIDSVTLTQFAGTPVFEEWARGAIVATSDVDRAQRGKLRACPQLSSVRGFIRKL